MIEQPERLLRARLLRIFDIRNLMYETIAHVRYIKILTWLWGFKAKIIVIFSRLFCLAIPKRELSTKKTKPNLEKWPESLGVMLEF